MKGSWCEPLPGPYYLFRFTHSPHNRRGLARTDRIPYTQEDPSPTNTRRRSIEERAVDIRVVAPDGTREFRERKRAPVSSRSAAARWAEGRERVLFERLMKPPQDNAPPNEVPTLREFVSRFLDGHPRANRQKPSGIAAKEMILRVHLVPALGHKRLDAIKSEDVQHLKGRLSTKAAKTVNNILTVLNVLLKKAVDWDVIDRMPCAITLLPVPKTSMSFYDFDEYERLVLSASGLDATAHLIVLLGGEAGLRCGEMIALEWRDVDLGKRQICVQRSDWNGQVTTPKGGRLRYVPLTVRLAAAFRDHRHLRSPNVLCQDDGQPLTRQMVQYRVLRASVERSCRRTAYTSYGTRFVRTWRCVVHRRERFRSSPVIESSA